MSFPSRHQNESEQPSRKPRQWWLPGAGLLLAVIAHATGAQAAGAASSSDPGAGRQPRQEQAGNRIEVSGNKVSGVRCANGGSASVNSVNVNGASLTGRTVISPGLNDDTVKEVDCADQPDGVRKAPAQINSITIR